MEPYITEEVLQCLSSVFIGHGVLVEENYDTIKILLTLFKQGEVPIKPIQGVIDPSNPRISITPGPVFSGRTRSEGGKVIQTTLPFTDFFTRNLLRADISGDTSADLRFTFNPTNIHTGFNRPAELIGNGTYGKIYKVEYGGKAYVIKEDIYEYSTKSAEQIEEHYRDLFREAFINVVLQHDPVYGGHVGRLIKVFRKGNTILFMMEYIENTLKQFLLTKNAELEATIAAQLMDDTTRKQIEDAYIIEDAYLTGFLKHIKTMKSASQDIPGHLILHNTFETNYPYKFKVKRTDGKEMELQLTQDGILLTKRKVPLAGQLTNSSKVDWTASSIQDFINAIKRFFGLNYFEPIFHTLACVLERFRNEYGFYHRDLHGGNVMVSGDGKVKLIDFGMSCMKEYTRDQCKSDDLLLFVFSIIQFIKVFDTQTYVKDIFRSFLTVNTTDGSENFYGVLVLRFNAIQRKMPLFHLMYYNKINKRPDWNDKLYGMYSEISKRFVPEKIKVHWGKGNAPKFIYDSPCDISAISHAEPMEEGVGGGGAAAAPAPAPAPSQADEGISPIHHLPSLTISASQETGEAEHGMPDAASLSPIAVESLLSGRSGTNGTGSAESMINASANPPLGMNGAAEGMGGASANPALGIKNKVLHAFKMKANTGSLPKSRVRSFFEPPKKGGRRTRRKRTTRKLKHRAL